MDERIRCPRCQLLSPTDALVCDCEVGSPSGRWAFGNRRPERDILDEKIELILTYVPQATLLDSWKFAKGLLIFWLVAFVFFGIAGFASEYLNWQTDGLRSSLPDPVWWALIFALFTWLLRGKLVHFVIPRSFRAWILMQTWVVFCMVLGLSEAPTWVEFPLFVLPPMTWVALVEFATDIKNN